LGHEVRILTLADESYIDRENRIYAVSAIDFNKIYPGARVKLFSGRSILKQMVRWQPDVIHTQTEFSAFRMAKEIAEHLNIPIVHTYHTI
ncbi:glycosyltransferase, partial [Salmonella enterica]|uniref:glycosyltransferase n=1 Tax=Salmonella enterica TaxID=28901 RepID=UPI000CAA968C